MLPGTPVRVAGEVPEFDISRFIPSAHRKSLKIMGRASRFGVAAGGLAVADSGLDLSRENPERVGVVLGTGLVPIDLPEVAPLLAEASRAGKSSAATVAAGMTYGAAMSELVDTTAQP